MGKYVYNYYININNWNCLLFLWRKGLEKKIYVRYLELVGYVIGKFEICNENYFCFIFNCWVF